jgi:hypothetical protein
MSGLFNWACHDAWVEAVLQMLQPGFDARSIAAIGE